MDEQHGAKRLQPPDAQGAPRREWSDDAYANRNRDLYRVELCYHCMDCTYNKCGVCSYAHQLSELMPPNESVRVYEGVWKDGVDRFFGQVMSDEQIQRIRVYYERTEPMDRPVWARGLYWYCTRKGSFEDCPYDFGLEQDWKTVRMFRVYSRQPFQWAPHLWDRIAQRRERLQYAQSLVAPASAIASTLGGMSEDVALPAPATSEGMSQDPLVLGEGRDASVPKFVTASASDGMSADVPPEEDRHEVSTKEESSNREVSRAVVMWALSHGFRSS